MRSRAEPQEYNVVRSKGSRSKYIRFVSATQPKAVHTVSAHVNAKNIQAEEVRREMGSGRLGDTRGIYLDILPTSQCTLKTPGSSPKGLIPKNLV